MLPWRLKVSLLSAALFSVVFLMLLIAFGPRH
jgi:hypothetical protein